MKYKAIVAQIESLQKKAEAARKAELSKTIDEIRAKMEAFGITIADLRDAAPKKRGKRGAKKAAKTTKRKVAAKYRDPASGAEWSGRGRSPRWLAAAMAKGAKIEQFLIKK